MNFYVFDNNAEDMLYAFLVAEEQQAQDPNHKVTDSKFLQCKFFHLGTAISMEDLKENLKCVDGVEELYLYFCDDGDLILRWTGGGEKTRDNLVDAIISKYGEEIDKYMERENFFEAYDFFMDGQRLKNECRRKQKKISKQTKELAKYFTNSNLIATLKKTIQLTNMQRAFRTKPHILIVEDQIFSQKMLVAILKDYECHVAEGSGDALLKYIEKCPDIVFLDIELPDLSGHHFAKLLNEIDPDSYVVMVSGNQYEKDIQQAKENNVKGFIAKPYEKQAILKTIQSYMKSKGRHVA